MDIKIDRDSFTDFKVKVNQNNKKEKELIQKRLLKLNFTWNSGSKEILYLEKTIFGFGVNIPQKRFIMFIQEEDFKDNYSTEITIKELNNKNFEDKLEKIRILTRLGDEKKNG